MVLTKEESKQLLERAQRLSAKLFNAVQTKFQPTDKLKKGPRRLLHILETRSSPNNGDTKINTKRLMEIIGKSKATVDRWLKLLKTMGYIAVYTTKYKSNINGKVYSDRTFRCRRIFLRFRFHPKTKKELQWKRDNRPEFVRANCLDLSTGKPCDFAWKIDPSSTFYYPNTMKKIKNKWETDIDLWRMGIIDPEQSTMLRNFMEMHEVGSEDKLMRLVLGTKHSLEIEDGSVSY